MTLPIADPAGICATDERMITMPNEPRHAKEKRSEPATRQNAQGDHEGSAHDPEEFDALNPQKQGRDTGKTGDTARSPTGR